MTDAHFDRSALESGVTVLSESLSSVRSVALGLWFAVGSRSETPAEAGMSHFIEHMMFKGTSRLSASDISESFDRLGAELNAFTGKEYTCYYARFLDQHISDALSLLAEMIGDSALADEAIVSEKEVVLEEIARHDDAPDDLVHDVLADGLWPEHPLSRPILGRREAVESFDRRAVRSYMDRHYRTGDLVVVAAGNLDHAVLVDLVGEHVSLPSTTAADRVSAPPEEPRDLTVLTKDTEQAHICLGVHALPAGHPDRFVLSVLDTIFGGGMSSRLFQEIREKRGLAYAVYSYHSSFRETGSLAVYVGTRPSNVEEVVALVRDQIASLVADGVTEDEISRGKESLKGNLVLGLENTRNRMTRIGKNEISRSEILDIDEIVARIDAVTAEDVRRLAGTLFSGTASLALVGPFDRDDVARRVS